MKEYIDFYATLQGELLRKKRMSSKLKKHWGTTTIDGVEVFNGKFKIWPGTDTEPVKKVLRLFGMKSSDINSQSKDGITALYLRFNSRKLSGNASYQAEALANIIERDIPFGKTSKLQLNYYIQTDPLAFKDFSSQNVIDYYETNKGTILSNTSIVEARGDTIAEDAVGYYILQEDGTDFEVALVSGSVVPVPIYGTKVFAKEDGTKLQEVLRYDSSISLEFEYKRTGHLNDDSPIVTLMMAETDPSKKLMIAEMVNSTGYDEGGWIPDESKATTNTIWYKGRLRTDVNKNLKSVDYFKVVMGAIDTTYDKKKTKWYKKLLVAIIAFTVGFIASGGNPFGGYAAFAAFATGVAITLTIGTMILARMGEYDGASTVGRWAKVAGIISFIAGITAAIQAAASQAANAARQAATQSSVEAAGTGVATASTATALDLAMASAAQGTVQASMTDIATTFAQNMVSGITSSTMNMASFAMKIVQQFVGMREKNKAKQLDSLRNEVEQQEAEIAEMYDKNLHLGLEDIKMYTKPLRVDNIQFEVDYLYEGDGMNIQRPSFYKATGLNEIVKV